ncbi:MAG: iron-sulfur cluster assembly accessory protein [Cystobacterineae bacterium]|nr:iron-sulfur cluster assembly accessory protein [Cystobacterineae bacterium]
MATEKTVHITDSAFGRLQKLLAERQTPSAGLKISVRGGGCSGLSYGMEWADAPEGDDLVFERSGVRIFVDPKSYLYLAGSELVYVETLTAAGFRLNNPNAKANCGCGKSFSC